MSNISKTFGTDKNLESGTGKELSFEDVSGEAFCITIHRAGGSNKKYARVFAEKMKPYRQEFDNGGLSDETEERILLESFVEGVVVGWKGVKDDKGKEIPFSFQACIEEFEQSNDFYLDVQNRANEASTFRAQQEDIEIKN